MSARPRVLLVRGHQANSWHLRPWRHLLDDYDVACLQTGSNWFDTELAGVPAQPVRTVRDLLPRGRIGDALTRLPGDRYLKPAEALAGAAIVHSQDLGFWYSMQAARLKPRLGHRLVLTVWETIPFLETWRNVRTRPYRKLVLERTDLFLAATERARECLLLEGAPAERIEVCPPGVDTALFAPQPTLADEHLIVSAGRLVWEKGHQDVLRAMAVLSRRGLRPHVRLVGRGPEEERLRAYAEELGLGGRVMIGPVSYEEMPAVFASASCMVLASLPAAMASLHPFGAPPRAFWEEQFGLVLAEAMAARLDILASESGAIPEVLAGQGTLFAPGDWPGLADRLAAGPLARAPGERVEYPNELVLRYSTGAMAERLAAAYDRVLS
jgi:glycosyltransferase involved in cell wall biosynthesis